MIVQAHNRLAFQRLQCRRHLDVFIDAEVDAIALGFPVRWIEVEKRVRAVVFLHALEPVQILNECTGQPQVCAGEVFFYAQQIDGWRSGGRAEGLAFDFAAEGVLLQIEEPCGALDVGQGVRWRVLQPFKHVAAAERVFELAHELFQMVFNDPVEIDKLAVDVVDHFDFGWITHEIKSGATGEYFDIA